MTEFQEHLRGIAYRMGLTYEEYVRLMFPLVEYDPLDKIPVLPPGTTLKLRAWDDFGHLPISTMADWTPGTPVSVAVRESIMPQPVLAFTGSSPLARWGGVFNPDMHNLQRAMTVPPDFFRGPLGRPFDPSLYDKDRFDIRKMKTYRYVDWKAAGFVPAPEVERIVREASAKIKRRLDAALIAHLIVQPPLSLGLMVYDLDTMHVFTNARMERDRITALGATSFRQAYVDETFAAAEIEDYWAEYIRNPPVDLDDCDTVFHEDPLTLDYYRED